MKQPLYLEIRSQVINKQIKQWTGQFCWKCLWLSEGVMSEKPDMDKRQIKGTEYKLNKAFMLHAFLFYKYHGMCKISTSLRHFFKIIHLLTVNCLCEQQSKCIIQAWSYVSS